MKIGLQLDENAFEQDVRELLMAFYPGAEFEYESTPEQDLTVSGAFEQEHTRYVLAVSPHGELAEAVKTRPEPSEPENPVLAGALQAARENEPLWINPADRADMKNQIKRRLYFLLMLQTGRALPWGALTGIRPVKIPEGKLALGWSEEEASAFMEEHYLTGPKKRKLSLDIAKEERRLLEQLPYEKGWSLYVGIPFCPTTCLYCSFTSYPIAKWTGKVQEYLKVLDAELSVAAEAARTEGKALQTIYIGGGTPTSLAETDFEELLALLDKHFGAEIRAGLFEYTVEAGRPDSITRGKLESMKRHRVTRISVNPQTMNQKTLDLIGRKHSVDQVKEIFSMARELGFDNINMDLILGLPGEGKEEVVHTLEEVEKLAPESLTVHCLALKRAARLNLEKELYKDYPMATGALIDELVDMAAEAAEHMGMVPYYLYRQKNMAGNLENVGYAQGDKASLYNILMMEEKHTVIGCGAGTTTKVVIASQTRVERHETIKNIQDYLPRWEEVIEKKRKFLESVAGLW